MRDAYCDNLCIFLSCFSQEKMHMVKVKQVKLSDLRENARSLPQVQPQTHNEQTQNMRTR